MKTLFSIICAIFLSLSISTVVMAGSTAYTCSLDDVTSGGQNATQCSYTEGNNDTNFELAINTTFGLSNDLIWIEAAKSDDLISRGLTASGETSGTWSYAHELITDFVIVLKGGNVGFASYFFTARTDAERGTFEINFENNGGQIPDLSHMTLYTVSAIPLPAALWLFTPALLGFMGFRRKAKKI